MGTWIKKNVQTRVETMAIEVLKRLSDRLTEQCGKSNFKINFNALLLGYIQ